MDLADLIQSFSTEPGAGTYVVTRRLKSAFVAGRAVPDSSPTTLQIIASVQPATGRDLLRLPEARRDNETRVVFTVTALQAGGQAATDDPDEITYEADIVTLGGAPWEVQHVESWVQPGGDPVFRCVAQAAR